MTTCTTSYHVFFSRVPFSVSPFRVEHSSGREPHGPRPRRSAVEVGTECALSSGSSSGSQWPPLLPLHADKSFRKVAEQRPRNTRQYRVLLFLHTSQCSKQSSVFPAPQIVKEMLEVHKVVPQCIVEERWSQTCFQGAHLGLVSPSRSSLTRCF